MRKRFLFKGLEIVAGFSPPVVRRENGFLPKSESKKSA
jgi:hypothetical protein